MANEIIIETTSQEVIEVGVVGPQGATGQGVPAGGTTGQVLRKASNSDYATEWATGGGGGVSSWNDLTDKPATFPPSSHTHPISEVTNLQTALDGKAATNHTHVAANVTDFDAAAAAAAPVQSVAGRTGTVTLAVADVANAVATSDARLTDSRTPLAHKASHATGGSDALSAADIGAAAANHTHTSFSSLRIDPANGEVGTLTTGQTTSGQIDWVRLGNNVSLKSSSNDFRASLAAGGLTADRALTIANRSGTVVVSDTSAGSGSDVVNNIVSLTQAEYNAISVKDAATLYLITDP